MSFLREHPNYAKRLWPYLCTLYNLFTAIGLTTKKTHDELFRRIGSLRGTVDHSLGRFQILFFCVRPSHGGDRKVHPQKTTLHRQSRHDFHTIGSHTLTCLLSATTVESGWNKWTHFLLYFPLTASQRRFHSLMPYHCVRTRQSGDGFCQNVRQVSDISNPHLTSISVAL